MNRDIVNKFSELVKKNGMNEKIPVTKYLEKMVEPLFPELDGIVWQSKKSSTLIGHDRQEYEVNLHYDKGKNSINATFINSFGKNVYCQFMEDGYTVSNDCFWLKYSCKEGKAIPDPDEEYEITFPYGDHYVFVRRETGIEPVDENGTPNYYNRATIKLYINAVDCYNLTEGVPDHNSGKLFPDETYEFSEMGNTLECSYVNINGDCESFKDLRSMRLLGMRICERYLEDNVYIYLPKKR